MSVKIYGIALAATTLLFFLFPGVDPAVSRWFFTPGYGFAFAGREPFAFIHDHLNWLMYLGLAATVGIFAYNLGTGSDHLGLRTRGFVFVILSLVLAPGIVANTVFKDHWGRARPVQTTEFGGLSKFTPAMVVSDQCDHNCSFVSGDPSVGFWLLCFALLLKRRRTQAIVGAIAAGALLGLIRIGQGGHFLSDVVFSGFFTCGMVWLLYELLMVPDGPARIVGILRGWWAWLVERTRFHAQSEAGLIRIAAVATGIAIVAGVLLIDVPAGAWARTSSSGTMALFQQITRAGLSDWYLISSGLGFGGLMVAAARTDDAARAKRLRSYALALAFVFLAVALSGILNDLIKIAFGRFRPKMYFGDQARYGLQFFGFNAAEQSFPSGHAATIFTMATILWLMWPRGLVLYAAIALLVGVSRVITGAHWPSDVVGGAFIGIVTTLWLRRFYEAKGITLKAALAGQAEWPKRGDGSAVLDLSATIDRARRLCFRLVGSRFGRLP